VCARGLLRRDDDEAGAGILDLGEGLRDTAEVAAADVSAGVPAEVHDRGLPAQVVLRDDATIGVLEPEGGEWLHVQSVAYI
jgi:hypothetical protein